MEEPSLLLLQTILIYLYALQLTDTRVAANRFWVMSGMAFRMVVAVRVTFSINGGRADPLYSSVFTVMFPAVALARRNFTPAVDYSGN
jgi:hypothetical protein